ncbi:putative RNA recognition domain containing protein [Blattamonas nauphoetae]|uniref:RNA recognition domain containing protein n=1 Tax=Blattamonas nauphoetae TaxID=2049346 RepID=A0ABQ9XHZ1_9EUKA|nr:putative RNA recognition domain containing protein [Blattamonas nauphoetae]
MTVYIGGFSQKTTEQELRDLFQQFGEITDFKFVSTDQKNFAFCTYQDDKSQAEAIKHLNRFRFKDRELKVSIPERKQPSSNMPPINRPPVMEIEPEPLYQPIAPQPARIAVTNALPVQTSQEIEIILQNQFTSEERLAQIEQFRTYMLHDPEAARSLLIAYPQLALAILQNLRSLGMSQDLPKSIIHECHVREIETEEAPVQSRLSQLQTIITKFKTRAHQIGDSRRALDVLTDNDVNLILSLDDSFTKQLNHEESAALKDLFIALLNK